MSFIEKIAVMIICLSSIAVVKFLSELTKSVDELNMQMAAILERVEIHDQKINDIEILIDGNLNIK